MGDHNIKRIFQVKNIVHSEFIYAQKKALIHLIYKKKAQIFKKRVLSVDKTEIAKRIKIINMEITESVDKKIAYDKIIKFYSGQKISYGPEIHWLSRGQPHRQCCAQGQ